MSFGLCLTKSDGTHLKLSLHHARLINAVHEVWDSLSSEAQEILLPKLATITDMAPEHRRDSMGCVYYFNGRTGVYLNPKLSRSYNPNYTIAHEFAHVYLDHVTARRHVVMKETEAHDLAVRWGYRGTYL